jgi:hypothetical protein
MDDPLIVVTPVLFPAVKVLAASDERVVFHDDDKVVKAAVEGVVDPMAVLFMPVAVVLKLAEVMSKLFTPVFMDDWLSPVSASVPEVEVRLMGPVVRVSPF